jgi:hypothetical protein
MQDEDRLRQPGQQRMMAVAPLAPGIEPLARPFLPAFPAEYRRIQIQRESARRAPQQPQQPTPERLNVRLREAAEKLPDGVSAGKTLQP